MYDVFYCLVLHLIFVTVNFSHSAFSSACAVGLFEQPTISSKVYRVPTSLDLQWSRRPCRRTRCLLFVSFCGPKQATSYDMWSLAPIRHTPFYSIGHVVQSWTLLVCGKVLPFPRFSVDNDEDHNLAPLPVLMAVPGPAPCGNLVLNQPASRGDLSRISCVSQRSVFTFRDLIASTFSHMRTFSLSPSCRELGHWNDTDNITGDN